MQHFAQVRTLHDACQKKLHGIDLPEDHVERDGQQDDPQTTELGTAR
jgi:hypothetical protein